MATRPALAPRLGRLKRRFATLATATALGLLLSPAQADDRALREALDAARQQQWSRIDAAAIDGHVLEGYVEYHRLKARLPAAEPAEVLAFIERHQDSPLAGWMRNQAIGQYGEAGLPGRLLAVSAGAPEGIERQCYYYAALLDRDPEEAARGGLTLWHAGRSQPDACDPLFSALRARGVIGDGETWERLMLAWKAGESGLASYLGRQLGGDWKPALDAYERVRGDYAAIADVAPRLGDHPATPGLVSAAMHGLTRADTATALDTWQRLAPRLTLGDERRQGIERDLAFYSLVREIAANRAWVDAALPRLATGDLLELRVRVALGERDWRGVRDWIALMPDDTRGDSRWQYWQGRALAQLGDPQGAQAAYERAAEGRSFFAFAAADRLDRPYALSEERHHYGEAQRREVAQWPVVRRTEALRRIDEPGLANSEWLGAVASADGETARRLADYAASRGWHAELVQTTIAGRMWDALAWRFPAAYRDSFRRWGADAGVDPYLLMAIARRESAYNPQALSPAGARGLMQLMPGTAALVSRRLGLADPGPYGVLEPELNIRLGSAYLGEMLERYRGNRLAAAAAYNAGPGRVDRWLRDAPQEFDLFVESIPFRETRDYVQAIMTYRVIFESLANGGESRGIALLSASEANGRYDTSLLARQ